MLRAISCATTVFIATAFVHAQDVRSTVGPLEQSAKPSSPENPIPRRTASAEAVLPPEFRPPANRATVRLQVTLNAKGRIGEIRQLVEPVIQFNPGTGIGVDEKTRRAMSDAVVRAAVEALQHWAYDAPAAPITFHVLFNFFTAPEPTAVQQDPSPVSALPARGTGAFPDVAPWPAAASIPRVGGAIRAPTQTKRVNPIYPPAAQFERVQGVVILEAIIGADGKVRDVRVLRSVPLLDDAAVDAVRQWEYTPAQLDGKPTPVVMTVTTNFTMDAPPRTPSDPLVVPRAPSELMTVAPWPAAEGAVRVGGNVPPPRLTKNVRPDFPRDAQASRVSGAVMLEALIGPDGKVRDVRIIRSSPLFDRAAMDAVRKWEYEPTRIDGTAVSVVMPVTLTFSIR